MIQVRVKTRPVGLPRNARSRHLAIRAYPMLFPLALVPLAKTDKETRP